MLADLGPAPGHGAGAADPDAPRPGAWSPGSQLVMVGPVDPDRCGGVPGPEEPNRDRGPLRDGPGWPTGQASAGWAVAGAPKISSAGLTRRRCQKPKPERISMTPARTKLTIAPIRAMCPSSQNA